jgi:hypothetical protein
MLILDAKKGFKKSAFAFAIAITGVLPDGSHVAVDSLGKRLMSIRETGVVVVFDTPRTVTPRLVGGGAVQVHAFKTPGELDEFDFDRPAPAHKIQRGVRV